MFTFTTCKTKIFRLQLNHTLKEVSNKSLVPPGGYFYYLDPDSQSELSSPYLNQLEQNARKHRAANNYPVGANWGSYFEDNVCQNTPKARCHEAVELSASQKATSLAKSLYQWAVSGFKTVSEAQYSERMAICQACKFYSGNSGALKVHCKKCGCTGLKIYLSSEKCPDNPPKWLPITT